MEKHNELIKEMNQIDVYTKKTSIQIMRAIGILMVCLHHAIVNLPFSQIINYLVAILSRIDVVVFFVISGFLFQKGIEKYSNDPRRFVINKTKQLVVPYLFWTLILYVGVKIISCFSQISKLLLMLGYEPKTWFQIAFSTLTYENYYVQHLWFVYTLFVFFVISITFKDNVNCTCLCVFGLVVYGLLNEFVALPYIIDKILKHFPDFCVGRWGYNIIKGDNKENIVGKINIVPFVIAFCLTVIRANFVCLPDFFLKSIYCRIELAANSWSAVVLTFFFSNYIQGYRIRRLLKRIGDYSYEIYLMHTPYIVPICVIALNKIGVPYVICTLGAVLLGVVVPIVVSKFIITKSKLLGKIMFGK